MQYFFFKVCCKINILAVPDLSPTNFEQPVSYMGSQIHTGHCKYMSREKIAFLADLRSIWIFNPNIFSSQSSRKVNGLNGLNEIHGMNVDFYHR